MTTRTTNAAAILDLLGDETATLRRMLHPVASRLPIIGRLPRFTNDLVFQETDLIELDGYVMTGFAIVYGANGIDYKIVSAQKSSTGDTWFALAWGDNAGEHTLDLPAWNPKERFRDAAGFRRVVREMRFDRLWAASRRTAATITGFAGNDDDTVPIVTGVNNADGVATLASPAKLEHDLPDQG